MPHTPTSEECRCPRQETPGWIGDPPSRKGKEVFQWRERESSSQPLHRFSHPFIIRRRTVYPLRDRVRHHPLCRIRHENPL